MLGNLRHNPKWLCMLSVESLMFSFSSDRMTPFILLVVWPILLVLSYINMYVRTSIWMYKHTFMAKTLKCPTQILILQHHQVVKSRSHTLAKKLLWTCHHKRQVLDFPHITFMRYKSQSTASVWLSAYAQLLQTHKHLRPVMTVIGHSNGQTDATEYIIFRLRGQ